MVVEAIQVIQDLAVIMVVALPMALICHRLGQPTLLGYILAGMIVGPYTPPFPLLTHPDILSLFSEIGIVFLLFAVGLEFPLSRLRSIGRIALVIAVTESLGTFGVAAVVSRAFGLSEFDSLFLGLAVATTSTVILSRSMEEAGVVSQGMAGLILGVTVLEDVVVVSALGVLQSIATTGGVAWSYVALGVALVVVFVSVTLAVGTRVIPPLVDLVARRRRADLLLVVILGVAFGLSIVASLIGISVATGAFLAGVLVADSESNPEARVLVSPLKELFGAIFFVSIGALMDIELLPRYVLLIAVLLGTAFAVKFALTLVAARSQQVPARSAWRTALGLDGPGGEVSLTVAKGGQDVSAISSAVLPIVGVITIVTAILSPSRIRLAFRGGPAPIRPPVRPPPR